MTGCAKPASNLRLLQRLRKCSRVGAQRKAYVMARASPTGFSNFMRTLLPLFLDDDQTQLKLKTILNVAAPAVTEPKWTLVLPQAVTALDVSNSVVYAGLTDASVIANRGGIAGSTELITR